MSSQQQRHLGIANAGTLDDLALSRLRKGGSGKGITAFQENLARAGGEIPQAVLTNQANANAWKFTGHGNAETPYYEALYATAYHQLSDLYARAAALNQRLEQNSSIVRLENEAEASALVSDAGTIRELKNLIRTLEDRLREGGSIHRAVSAAASEHVINIGPARRLSSSTTMGAPWSDPFGPS